jgi:hypothetical protein
MHKSGWREKAILVTPNRSLKLHLAYCIKKSQIEQLLYSMINEGILVYMQ